VLARILQYLTVVNYHTESPYLCIQHSGRVSGHLTAHKHYVKLFSPSGKLARMAIYFACVNFFFFNLRQIISGSTGPIFTIFLPNERYLRELFLIPLETLPWQPILFRTGLFARSQSILGSAGPIFTIFPSYGRY